MGRTSRDKDLMPVDQTVKIAFHTLGCKINQFDTAAMQEQARQADHEIVPFDHQADVYVINTCSVTERSDSQSRQLVRKALRTNPLAKIVVTGCYAQTNPEALLEVEGVDLVLGTQERGDWLNYLGGCEKAVAPQQAVSPTVLKEPLHQPLIRRFGGHTRAFVKVQDGCDARCSFCLIPRARGPSRSLPLEGVIEQVCLLVEGGHQEIVLTGVNLGFYGRDFRPKLSLAYLISQILERTSVPRLRLSSIEPKTVTPELKKALTSSPRICRHLHIPLQSGDDQVLKRMNRHYRAEYYQRLIEGICQRMPGAGIGTDVMVGFPGEGEAQFRHTYEMLSRLPMSYFHVFTYSPRPQTPAARMGEQVPERIRARRSQALRALAGEKLRGFQEGFLGQTLEVLVEQERDPGSGLLKGYSDNYIKVLLSGPDTFKNMVVPVKVHSVEEQGMLGFSQFGAAVPL